MLVEKAMPLSPRGDRGIAGIQTVDDHLLRMAVPVCEMDALLKPYLLMANNACSASSRLSKMNEALRLPRLPIWNLPSWRLCTDRVEASKVAVFLVEGYSRGAPSWRK